MENVGVKLLNQGSFLELHMINTGVWRSLVARTLGVGEVAGSNPVTPI